MPSGTARTGGKRALEEELRSDRFSQLLSLMETSAKPPVLEFRVVSRRAAWST